MMKTVRWVPLFKVTCLFFLLLPLLSGCAFHLRGTMDMPPWLNHVSVIIEKAHRDLGLYLVQNLEAYQRDMPMDPKRAQFLLFVEQDNLQENITSISSSTTPRQYELIYKVRFRLVRSKGEELIPSNEVSVSRQMTINSNRILGSNQEEELLKAEMRRDAAMQIINRISKETSNKGFHP